MRDTKGLKGKRGSFARHFEGLADPRVQGRCKHPLVTVIVMALSAVVAGCHGWEAIEDFCEDRAEWFTQFLELPHGVPDATTFLRVFRALRPDAVFVCITAWVQTLAQPLDGQVVAFDGKSFRGALKRSPLGASLHAVHVWACRQQLLLAQTHVPGAPEEVPAVRDLLELLDLRGALVTGDAAHCTRETAQSILDAEADWLLQLKANRSAAYTAVQTFFDAARATAFVDVTVRHHREAERGHGRVEIREAWTVPASACPLPGAAWPGFKSLTLIERTRVDGDLNVSREQHFYLSSLAPSVRRIMAGAREHWGVENGLHWVLDVQMGEDGCAIGDENAAANLGSLRRLALMLARRETTFKRGKRDKGVAAKQAKAHRNTAYLEKLLTAGITED
jgi:predicted transposase YbfD/YdcC